MHQSVGFLGWQAGGSDETLNGAHLIYRFKIAFPQVVQVNSVTVTGGGDYYSGGNQAVLRLLDQNESAIGSLPTSYLQAVCPATYTLSVSGAFGQTFYIDEFDYSTNGRYRSQITIVYNNSNMQLTCDTATGPTQVGTSYSATCTASGGTAPYAWSVLPNIAALPQGLAPPSGNSNSATISGTPTKAGKYSYSVKVTDSTVPTPQAAQQAYGGNIVPTPGSCVDSNGDTVPLAYTVTPYVQPQKQLPSHCWATQAGIMLTWKRGLYTSGSDAAYIADNVSPKTNVYLTDFRSGLMDLSDYTDFLLRLGIIAALPSNPAACDISLALQQYGPMTVVVGTPKATFVHAEVLTGISGDGSVGGSTLAMIDPDSGTTRTEGLGFLLQDVLNAPGWPEFVHFQ